MMWTMLVVLDWFFLVFHSALVLFNCLGWAWNKTRLANLITLVLTGLSWFVLGIFKGIGYCPLTSWHWKVLDKLGVEQLPGSYINYLSQRLTGIDLGDDLADTITASVYFLALITSIMLNYRHRKDRINQVAA
jgi:hypothetical protein